MHWTCSTLNFYFSQISPDKTSYFSHIFLQFEKEKNWHVSHNDKLSKLEGFCKQVWSKIFRFIPRPRCGRPCSPFWILQFLQISNPSFPCNLLKVPRELVSSKKDGSFIASIFSSVESIDFGRGCVLYRTKANDLWSSKILLRKYIYCSGNLCSMKDQNQYS